MTRFDRLALGIFGVVALAGAFIFGFNVGNHAAGCEIVRTNAQAMQSDPKYWESSMRTLVEACQKGE